MEVIHKIGRRKTAVARVYLAEGSGKITVNKKDMADYFTTATLQYKVNQPLALTNNDGNFDITVNVYGGGITGQAEAIRLGLSRIMCEIDPENRLVLKPEGLLTRDPRMVERKKFGQKKARKKFQFSKR
ncbi:30S ribosomal protein S9 [Winogradskyella undariae]|uniref:Small ribosomal subunit protein uS9 n=1 Tax=Winogradskyella thalassocola TaxID=262004 RepID=A0A1G7VNC6_9FLAO|nr:MULTISPECIES: 30S ribosomal protein S9 [Winogradskyella]NRR92206.1 30S ribosomal protein S9 [Winogradskyella undariae]QNK77247.1 30S ribosomal protein S9 [Winogradskyella sp. PAMC22761]QXP80195.1 30S ribosomal protein S9 [Winogradskyella sp. HaHa_3_26]SDG61322.1 SSU ribosomal protein S9P [Winogradskyella thalassocola]